MESVRRGIRRLLGKRLGVSRTAADTARCGVGGQGWFRDLRCHEPHCAETTLSRAASAACLHSSTCDSTEGQACIQTLRHAVYTAQIQSDLSHLLRPSRD